MFGNFAEPALLPEGKTFKEESKGKENKDREKKCNIW